MNITWASLAKSCDVQLCKQCPNYNHRLGAAEPSTGKVHWAERRVTRAGIRSFLKLVGSIVYSHNRGQPRWQQIYEQNMYVTSKAAAIGVRIPSHLSDTDRAWVHDLLKRKGIHHAKALRWALRR